MIYVTHDQVEAMTLATRIVVMDRGAIRQVGTPLGVYERPANRFVAGFLDAPVMAVVDGMLDAAGLFAAAGLALSPPPVWRCRRRPAAWRNRTPARPCWACAPSMSRSAPAAACAAR
jgi:multiple sugar transport system ATP-binding protein